jgi:prepilin-type processing-associated H-X9-DG protein
MGMTYYQVFTGKDSLYPTPDTKVKIVQITDGTSNTGLVFEAKDPVIWTKPEDLVLPKEGGKMPELGPMFKDGMNVAYCDGSVHWLRRDIDPKTLRALITPNGGEVIDEKKLEPPAAKQPDPPKPPPPAKEPAPQKKDALRALDENNLKRIGLAMQDFHDTYDAFPAKALYSKDRKRPLLSWRVTILPFIEQKSFLSPRGYTSPYIELYNQFKLDEPWDSEHNKKLIAKMPSIYEPVGMGKIKEGMTHNVVFTGPNTVFEENKQTSITMVADSAGTSNTALVFEARDAVIWTKPDDLVFPKEGGKMPEVGGMFKDGMHVLFCDGSVQWVRRDIDAAALRLIVNPLRETTLEAGKK